MYLPTLGTSSILDRASDRRGDRDYLDRLMQQETARFLILADHKPVIVSDGPGKPATIRWLGYKEVVDFGFPVSDSLFLGCDRETGAGVFAVSISEHRVRNAPGALHVLRPIVDVRSLASEALMPEHEIALVGLAKALSHWHENTRCCGHCGGTMSVKDGGWRRQCWACGHVQFPRVDPVVIMLVIHPQRDRCLLAHEKRFRENMYSALAGYLEPGEDVEHAVRREVMEEVSIKVGKIRFHATQPWPFPHTLMIGCFGYAESDEISPDQVEIADARWFTRTETAGMLAGTHPDGLFVPGRQAIANTLIRCFNDGLIE